MAVAALLVALALIACAPGPPPAASAPHARPETPGEPAHPPAMPIGVGLPSDPGEAGVRAFVTAFLEARQQGNAARARDFLSSTALEQFGEGKLQLTGGADGRSISRWEILSLQAADANSWEAKVRLFHPGGTEGDVQADEMLFIGPGEDASGARRTWIVRGAEAS